MRGSSLHRAFFPSAREQCTLRAKAPSAVPRAPGNAGVALVPHLTCPPTRLAGLALLGKTGVSPLQLTQSTREAVSLCFRTPRPQLRSLWLRRRSRFCPGDRDQARRGHWACRGWGSGGYLPQQLRTKPILRRFKSEPSLGFGVHCGLENLPGALRPLRVSFLLGESGSTARRRPGFVPRARTCGGRGTDTAGKRGARCTEGPFSAHLAKSGTGLRSWVL